MVLYLVYHAPLRVYKGKNQRKNGSHFVIYHERGKMMKETGMIEELLEQASEEELRIIYLFIYYLLYG